jgi:hypothetical protein
MAVQMVIRAQKKWCVIGFYQRSKKDTEGWEERVEKEREAEGEGKIEKGIRGKKRRRRKRQEEVKEKKGRGRGGRREVPKHSKTL